MKILFFLLVFLLLGGFIIISNENLHILNEKEREKFGEMYLYWFDNLFDNFKGLTAYIINTNWIPDNDYNVNLTSVK